MDPHPEDFGQTLGKWGVPSGSYWVLPFLGPSTPRDAAGYIERFATNPTTYALWNQHWAWGVGSSAIILTVMSSSPFLDYYTRASAEKKGKAM